MAGILIAPTGEVTTGASGAMMIGNTGAMTDGRTGKAAVGGGTVDRAD
jgi:hypothetical protein